MSKLIDKEQLAKLAQGLDQRMKDAVAAEKARAEAAEGAVDTKANKNAEDIAAIMHEETGIEAVAKAFAEEKVAAEKERAEAQEAAIREEFVAADDVLKAALQGEIDADVKVEADRAVAEEAKIREEMAAMKLELQGEIDADVKVEEEARIAAVEAEKTAREGADQALDARLQVVEAFFGQEEEGGEVLDLSSVNAAIKAADDKAVAAQGEVDALELVVDALDARVEVAEGEIDALQLFVEEHSHEKMEEDIAANAQAIAKEVEDRAAEIERVEGEFANEIARVEGVIGAKAEGEEAATGLFKVIEEGDAATLESAKGYADEKIAALVDSAPDAMNTLNELATAINAHQDVYDAYIEQQSSALTNLKTELQAEIDADVKVEKERAVAEEARIEGLVTAEVAKAREEEGKLQTAIENEVARAEAVEGGFETRIAANEAFVAAQPDVDKAQDEKIAAVEKFVEEHSHEGLQGEIDALEGRADALEEFMNGHDHSVMEQGIADNKAAIEKEVEDRDAAIAAALEAYSTTEEMKAILGNVVNSLALSMEDNKLMLKLGGVEGITIHETSLDMATDEDINAILAGLDEEE